MITKHQPLFEIVTTTMGATSIRNNIVNEIMHNPVGPWKEANALYIDQSNFRKKIRASLNYTTPFTVFDVGLGAGANALATLAAYQEEESLAPCAPVTIVSYEIDLRLIEFTLENIHHFEHYNKFQKPLRCLLTHGTWQHGNIKWILRHGDFTELVESETETADLIFYDAYSPKVNPEMWTFKCFSRLFQNCHSLNTRAASLFTYSRSTPVRTALLAAGFYVGLGQPTGLKEETTEASTTLQQLSQPLDQRWLGRWQRSATPLPSDSKEYENGYIQFLLDQHPQIKSLILSQV